jgi:Protein kinase domain
MATVYLARQLDLDRLVALKELRALSSSDPSFATRFLREARMAGSLSHPNIVTVHDYIESGGTPFIAMEYVERGSLRPHIGQMSLAQVGGVLEGVLAGLEYAGQRGIVHRDIKPENVMIASDGRVKIADFGIAKARNAFQTSGSLTADGTALGTPNYMAPEQASAEEVGPATDIYSVGIMAFEMFVGRPPFADTPAPLVVIMRQVRDPIPHVTDLDPTIDPRIADWISWLTAKAPAERPQSAAEAWDGFEGILAGLIGARWARGAPLLPGIAALPTVAAAVPTGAVPLADRTTRPMGGPRTAATVAPNPNLLGMDRTQAFGVGVPAAEQAQAADAGTKRRGRRRGFAAMAAAAVIALVAFAALKHDSTPVRAASDRAPATPAKARKASSQSNAARQALAQTTTPTPASTAPAAVSAGSDLSKQAAQARSLAHRYNVAAAKIEGLPASGSQADQNAILADLTRKTAHGYSDAAAAASRGDAQGYATALGDALAAKDELNNAARAPAPASNNSGGGGGGSSASSCAGDSVSDDPSDDSCGGGEP